MQMWPYLYTGRGSFNTRNISTYSKILNVNFEYVDIYLYILNFLRDYYIFYCIRKSLHVHLDCL